MSDARLREYVYTLSFRALEIAARPYITGRITAASGTTEFGIMVVERYQQLRKQETTKKNLEII